MSTILSGQEPVARVRIQGTTSWGTRKHVSGEVTGDLSGKHALYIVYNIKNDNSAGANIFNIYFEPKAEGVSVSDLTIKASDFVVEESGTLDKLTGCIQSTSTDTRICLGEVDFGEDGSKYSAVGIDFANGWSTDGWAILYAGQDFESASPFVQIALDETNGYQIYYTFVDSMAYLKGPNHDGVFEGAQATFVKPTGVQKVWFTFKDGNGNIRSVKFFENQLQPEDLVQDGDGRPGWWGKSVLRFPSERAGYSEISVKRLSTESTPAVPMGDDSEFKDVRLDGDSWGWTKKGFIADYGEVDFGSGEYDQVIVYVKRDGDSGLSRFLEVYIDEVKDENMIASIWADLHMKEFYPIAKNIESITGTHRVLVRWTDGGPNLRAVEFSKGAKWEEGLVCGIQIVDELPSDKAFRVKFEGSPEGVAEPWSYEILANGRREDSGNIGYTKNGTVIKLFDSSAADKLIDFGNGYTDIVVDHACDKTWLGEIDDANFSFYLDLDPNGQYSSDDWSNNLSTILSGQEPVARVRIQGTTSWGTRKHVSGEVTGDLSGKHALYIVYNIKNDNSAGANIFNIYFEPNGEPTSVQATGAVESVNVFVADGQIIVKAAESVKVATYTLSGAGISETIASAGTNTYDAAPGFYIVKVTDKNGTVTTYKVLVK